ncbi:FAD-NAD(P)-binding protein [Prosthecobacter fusiformis]|uniref:FAD-NAD(P)-binding protein n=1 Tax=Prosthecobacter fusiformis TaxID=48464 RepID=A0A4R7RMC7_9BACT|nr:FAD/NAD(P)-binding protein [Prosthecobacter fusiformis]TDU66472.1 FAD-NAD(P)-binding protein [Prosthecobacter fusiformis]
MNSHEPLAIIGSGPSCIFLLKHLLDQAEILKPHFPEVAIFEKSSLTGMGMPYNPQTTDRYNMSNISSEELPELPTTLVDWLRNLEPEALRELDLENVEISESEVYSRLALGQYLKAQYDALIALLAQAGIRVREYPDSAITDVQDHPSGSGVTLTTATGSTHLFDRIVIATGHHWAEEDKPAQGYYASPWPITKLLPPEGKFHNFPIGTLGASLSAFDVVSSLTHRHGRFVTEEDGHMTYQPHPGTENFKITMHSSEGLLPHLQFDQVEPMRKIYRHLNRNSLLGLIDDSGFLRIETYFDKICRPALRTAFEKDEMKEMVQLLDDSDFSLTDFVEKMSAKHEYADAFEGMRTEMVEAKESVENHQPVHWKEVMDDLMYTLNFHAGLMPAEDHLLLHSEVMPFLLNVVAAMPLNSADTILALHQAGKLEIVAGKVTVAEEQKEPGSTTITVADEDQESTLSYRMFIDCSGQKPLELEDYPFPSLVKDGTARKARTTFDDAHTAAPKMPDSKKEHLFKENGRWLYHTGGIDIDGAYRLIDSNGKSHPRIHDIAFPHTSGKRPYSYGLQACNDTSAIVVQAWVEECQRSSPVNDSPAAITRIYEKIQAAD